MSSLNVDKLPLSTDVLIVGAGPAGLACANSLLKNGIKNFTILDARAEGSPNLSRAIVVHARTVEELDAIDCAGPLVMRGRHAHCVAIQSALDKVLLKGNFESLSTRTKFPYALLISQSDTEDTLERNLNAWGINVLKPFRVAGFEGTIDGIKVLFETGEVVMAKYVVGADGLRSTVRRLANIQFRDPSTNQDIQAELSARNNLILTSSANDLLVIADVYFSTPLPGSTAGNSINVLFGPMGFLLIVQLPAAKYDATERPIYRLVYPPEKEGQDDSLEYVQKVLNSGLGLPQDSAPIVEKIIYSSQFRARSAVADVLYCPFGGGQVMLIGDAAHIHSPAGGQGMNLGIRDAVQLGRVLSSIINFEKASVNTSSDDVKAFAEKSLSDFSLQRRKKAVSVIAMTNLLSWAIGLKSAPARIMRNFVLKIMGSISFIRNKMLLRLSGLE